MPILQSDPLLQVETTCDTLLCKLQIIWDEVGEPDAERDKMLLEIEQECLEVYRRKVDHANCNRAQLRQVIADSESELATICSAMGERPVHIRQADQNAGSLKEELSRILLQLEGMRKRKSDRRSQFLEVLEKIQRISSEIYRSSICTAEDETDLSLRKLEELHRQLQELEKEKSDRLKLIQEQLHKVYSFCLVLGVDFKHTVSEIHPSLVDNAELRNISNDTIQHLSTVVNKLQEVKIQRMQKLQDLATTMLELWNLMDTPIEEQQMFQNVTSNIAASEDEITEANNLSVHFINYVEAEVSRLEELKSTKMKELVLKKRSELEEICRKTHIVPEVDTPVDFAIEVLESGNVDPAGMLEQIELQTAIVKEEAFNRKEILEKVEKWLAACEEESWLEEYNRDESRYNAGRGVHLILKRAEKARSLVNKLPGTSYIIASRVESFGVSNRGAGMVESLASKVIAWEKERGVEFLYDGVRLLSMLEEYTLLRQEKEEERRRQRDQKKLQGQLIAEQEALYGSKPSPSKPQSVKTAPRVSTGGPTSRRLSVGGAMLQTPKATPCPGKKADRIYQKDHFNHHQDDGFAALSSGRRELDISGLPLKKQSIGGANHACEHEVRRPFSPVSSTTSSKSNLLEDCTITNVNMLKKLPASDLPICTPSKIIPTADSTKTSGDMLKKLPKTDLPLSTPSKTISTADEENGTPKMMPNPVPVTPSTVSSIRMQIAVTPAVPPSVPFSARIEIPEEIEYSFEERRAGFVIPKEHTKSIIQV